MYGWASASYPLNFLTKVYTLHKHKLSDGESQTILSLLRKELQDEHLKPPSARSSAVVSSSSMAPDPLLMPFLYNPPPTDKPAFQDVSSTETSLSTKASDKSTLERYENYLKQACFITVTQ